MSRKWITVKSSQIKKISYDKATEMLYIEFKNHTTYSYEGVTAEEFENFKASESIGKFLYANIKNVKSYKKLT